MSCSTPFLGLNCLAALRSTSAIRGRVLGGPLLREAMQRTLKISQSAGVRALMVHAIDDEAVFYLRYGFVTFPADSRTMFLPIGPSLPRYSARFARNVCFRHKADMEWPAPRDSNPQPSGSKPDALSG